MVVIDLSQGMAGSLAAMLCNVRASGEDWVAGLLRHRDQFELADHPGVLFAESSAPADE